MSKSYIHDSQPLSAGLSRVEMIEIFYCFSLKLIIRKARKLTDFNCFKIDNREYISHFYLNKGLKRRDVYSTFSFPKLKGSDRQCMVVELRM